MVDLIQTHCFRRLWGLFVPLLLTTASFTQSLNSFSPQPPGFIKNQGQIIDQKGSKRDKVLYKASFPNGVIYFQKERLVFMLRESPSNSDKIRYFRYDLTFKGSQTDIRVEPDQETGFHTNYYQAHCPEGITGVPHYKRLTYKNIYPGIDFRFRAKKRGLKYDIILHPDARPQDIQLAYKGVENLSLCNDTLRIKTPLGELQEFLPRSYTVENRSPITVNYTLEGNTVSFSVDQSCSQTRVIDPALVWSTYYPMEDNTINKMNMSVKGEQVVISGTARDPSIPTLNPGGGAYYQDTLTGNQDIYILRFTKNGVRKWATYFGGNKRETMRGDLAIDENANILIGATTRSDTLPVKDNGGHFVDTLTGTQDIMAAKFDSSGNLLWSSYYPMNPMGHLRGIDAGPNNELYMVGTIPDTTTMPIQTLAGAYNQTSRVDTNLDATDAFLLKFDNNTQLQWATYFGKPQPANERLYDVEVTKSGALYTVGGIVGDTASILKDHGGYMDSTHNGLSDLLICKFDTNQSLQWSTLYGGSDKEGDTSYTYSITSDQSENAYIVSTTTSSDFPTLDNGGYFNSNLGGVQDAFIIKFDSATNQIWSTYFGSFDRNDHGTVCDISDKDSLYIAGFTKAQSTSDFPLKNKAGAYNQSTPYVGWDGFASQFDPKGNLIWSTFLADSAFDKIHGGSVYTTPCGENFYLTGATKSRFFPLRDVGTKNYFQTAPPTSPNVFITRLGAMRSKPSDTAIATPSLSCEGDTVTLETRGGMLGSNADWHWYEIGCGNTLVGTGRIIQTTPDFDKTYYVRAEGECNTTICDTVSVTVKSETKPPDSISTTPADSICPDSSVTLSQVGGSLGYNANWYWYKDSCGLTVVDSNTSSITVTPDTTTRYFVRGEGFCNITSCTKQLIVEKTSSTAATGISAVSDTICRGDSTLLYPQGGDLGVGGKWSWYKDSCGSSTHIGIGDTIKVGPRSTDTFYVRAENGCEVTGCASTVITVFIKSTLPTELKASKEVICKGETITMYPKGGSLGSQAQWHWYAKNCADSFLTTGDTLQFTPPVTTNYYVQAEGYCGVTGCVSNEITVSTDSKSPSDANATPSQACQGDSILLTQQGGQLGNLAEWHWYRGSCGGTFVKRGDSIKVQPSGTRVYYVRAQGPCDTSTCASVSVTVNNNPIAGFSVSTDCADDSASFNEEASPDVTQWKWEFGDGDTSTKANPKHLYDTGMTYTVQLTVTNSAGCTDTSIQTIDIRPVPPQPPVPIGPTSVCHFREGRTYQTDTVRHATQYHWTTPPGASIKSGQNTKQINVRFDSTSGEICVRAENQCSESAYACQPINLYPPPQPNAGADTTIYQKDKYRIGGTPIVTQGKSPYTFHWSPSQLVSDSFASHPFELAQQTTTFILTVKDANQCSRMDTVTIKMEEKIELFIPNTITPNGDGQNDFWRLQGVEKHRPVSVEVYNRWGNLVYKSEDYQNDWKGTHEGEDLPNGTYYYILNLKGQDSNRTGTLTILR